MALRFISIALSLAVELALVRLPYLKLSELSSGSWKVLELTTSKPIP